MRTRYLLAASFAAFTLALMSACGGSPASPSATSTSDLATTDPGATTPAPSGTDVPAVVPTSSAAATIHFTVDGTGPYQLGAMLDALQAAGALAEVTTGGEICPPNTYARGTGAYADVRLSFRPDGRLYLVTNRSAAIPTPSGAYIGTTLAQLNTIYAGVTHEELGVGIYGSFLVTTVSGRGILFDLDEADRVFTMTAGEAAYLKSSYLNGTDYC